MKVASLIPVESSHSESGRRESAPSPRAGHRDVAEFAPAPPGVHARGGGCVASEFSNYFFKAYRRVGYREGRDAPPPCHDRPGISEHRKPHGSAAAKK